MTDTIDGRQTDFDLGGDFGVRFCPAFLAFVGEKQNAGAFAFSLGMALEVAPTGEFFTLGFGQTNMIFFR